MLPLFLLRLESWENLSDFEVVEDLIEQYSLSSSAFEGQGRLWYGEWIFETQQQLNQAHEILLKSELIQSLIVHTSELRETDWLEENYKSFTPIDIGSFFIYGSHNANKIELPKDKICLLIDAATAFGSGSHGTTAGCLMMLKKHAKPHQKVLDMGCGSAILSLAAAKMGLDVFACDNDPEAVRVSVENTKINDVADMVKVFCGDGFNTKEVLENKPYDIIIANILANPLIQMAYDMSVSVSTSAKVILSGITTEQSASVQNAYEEQGFSLIDCLQKEDWVTLVFSNAK